MFQKHKNTPLFIYVRLMSEGDVCARARVRMCVQSHC